MKVKVNDKAEILAGNEYDFSSDITILVGANGSGKSTLLKAIILKQISNWEFSSDYKLPLDKITITDNIFDLGYYIAENNNKLKMSHMSDDIFAHIQDMKSSSGEATFNQVLRALNHNLIILDEPDQSLDMCNSIILKELLPRVVIRNKSKIILTVHSAYLLQKLSELSNVKILQIESGEEITAEDYLLSQHKKAMTILGKI